MNGRRLQRQMAVFATFFGSPRRHKKTSCGDKVSSKENASNLVNLGKIGQMERGGATARFAVREANRRTDLVEREARRTGGSRLRQFSFQFFQALQLLVALPTLKAVDTRGLEDFALR